MSKWDKLILRIKSLDKNMRFEELQKVLEFYGYQIYAPRGGSSHCTFRKDNEKAITIPKYKPVKVFYVALVKEIVEMEEKKHENN
jgi:predicted RNA binding protein YcfA (HicA-like mRNA interferase family)